MRLLFVGMVMGIAVIGSDASADCLPTPSVCYCPDAVAVVDGHVETVAGEPDQTVDVRIDALTRDASDVLPALVEGELITIQPIYHTELSPGDRVLFGVDGDATLAGEVFPVSASDTVSCSQTFNHEASLIEATGWLLSETGQCRAALEEKGWMKPCDDTKSCGVAPVSSDGSLGGWAFVAIVAALGWIRRRR